MPCERCKKKCGIPIDCKYCEGKFCPRCLHLEKHNCPGIELKINKDLKHLEKKVEFTPDCKYAFVR